MIRELENGWEQWTIMICSGCRDRLYQPGGGGLAARILVAGGCGHPYPGTP